jgi:hypothetical protein
MLSDSLMPPRNPPDPNRVGGCASAHGAGAASKMGKGEGASAESQAHNISSSQKENRGGTASKVGEGEGAAEEGGVEPAEPALLGGGLFRRMVGRFTAQSAIVGRAVGLPHCGRFFPTAPALYWRAVNRCNSRGEPAALVSCMREIRASPELGEYASPGKDSRSLHVLPFIEHAVESVFLGKYIRRSECDVQR